jgi:hypothetical protein
MKKIPQNFFELMVITFKTYLIVHDFSKGQQPQG